MSANRQSPGVVIVGASIAGVTVAETLRAEGYEAPITLIGREPHIPYNRPPLSKQVLTGDWAFDETVIRDAEGLAELHVDLRRDEPATRLDLSTRTVHTSRGSYAFEHLVIATGVTPRRLPGTPDTERILSLRTIEDALSIRERLVTGGHVLIIGGGILGCEVASAARKHGCEVTLVGRGTAPSVTRSGGFLSDSLVRLLQQNEVTLCPGVGVARLDETDAHISAHLSDGAILDADTVVVAIGCEPEISWLADSGLDVTDGVLCDTSGRAAEGVYAVGDVARWRNAQTGHAVRVEHQLTAIEQAQAVARHIVNGHISDPIEPFFWTELFGTRILVYGTPDPELPLSLLTGAVDDQKFLAASVREGQTHALISWNMPREFRLERAKMIASAMTHEPLGV